MILSVSVWYIGHFGVQRHIVVDRKTDSAKIFEAPPSFVVPTMIKIVVYPLSS